MVVVGIRCVRVIAVPVPLVYICERGWEVRRSGDRVEGIEEGMVGMRMSLCLCHDVGISETEVERLKRNEAVLLDKDTKAETSTDLYTSNPPATPENPEFPSVKLHFCAPQQ